MLEIAELMTLDQLNKELDVDYKLRSRTERLYKRYFHKKTMKAIISQQHSPPPPPLIEISPTLAITATTPEE